MIQDEEGREEEEAEGQEETTPYTVRGAPPDYISRPGVVNASE